jgi:hypothetical protein
LSFATAQTSSGPFSRQDASAAIDRAASTSRPSNAAKGHRLLHRLPAQLQETCGIAYPERTRRRQRGVFAERMPRHIGDISGEDKPTFRLENAHHCKARRHQRRLGIFGQSEIAFWALEHQARQSARNRVIDLAEQIACRSESRGEVTPHADSLRALAGKYKCPLHPECAPQPTIIPAPDDAAAVVIAAPSPVSRRRCGGHLVRRIGFCIVPRTPCRPSRLGPISASVSGHH